MAKIRTDLGELIICSDQVGTVGGIANCWMIWALRARPLDIPHVFSIFGGLPVQMKTFFEHSAFLVEDVCCVFFMVWKLHQFHHPTIWIRLVKWGAFHAFADLIYIVFPRDTLGQLRRVIWVSESKGFGRTWVLSQAWLWVQIDASHS